MFKLDIGNAIGGVGKIIDDIKTTDEERAEARTKLRQVEVELTSAALEYELGVVNAQRDVLVAEAQSQSWIARNWRPMLMLTFGFIILNNYVLLPWLQMFGVEAPTLPIPEGMWNLLTVGVGGYVVGRSAEKVTKTIRSTEDPGTDRLLASRADRREMKEKRKTTERLGRIAKKQGWSPEELSRRIDAVLNDD